MSDGKVFKICNFKLNEKRLWHKLTDSFFDAAMLLVLDCCGFEWRKGEAYKRNESWMRPTKSQDVQYGGTLF